MGNPCREITRCRRIVAAGTGRQSIGADTSAEMKDEKREKEGKEEKRKRKKKYGKRSKVRGEGEMLSCRLRSARCFFSFSSVLSFFFVLVICTLVVAGGCYLGICLITGSRVVYLFILNSS